jgi:hypothetical protein
MNLFWFRYLGDTNVQLGPESLKVRGVYAATFFKNKFYVLLEEEAKNNGNIEVSDKHLAEILRQSRPMRNKQTLETTDLDDLVEACTAVTENKVTKLRTDLPKIPKSLPLKIDFQDEVHTGPLGTLLPIPAHERKLIETALNYIGSTVTSKARGKSFLLAYSPDISTCLMTTDLNKVRQKQFIVFNMKQLNQIFHNTVSVADIAQVITHEFAHYISMYGLIKQSDKERFRLQISGRMLHRNQYEHPGYSYPWYEEAFAILAEYMVHGKSARRLSSSDGWEIVEKYFDNNYLKGGIPSGEKVALVR